MRVQEWMPRLLGFGAMAIALSSTGCKFALALVITGLHDVDTHWSWRQQRGTRTQGTSEPRAWWHSILLLVFI